jgi:hypothetical protein
MSVSHPARSGRPAGAGPRARSAPAVPTGRQGSALSVGRDHALAGRPEDPEGSARLSSNRRLPIVHLANPSTTSALCFEGTDELLTPSVCLLQGLHAQ